MNQQYVSTTVICLKPIKKIWNKKCKIDECNKRSKINGVCVKHGAITPRCKIEECGKKSIKNGVCINHGAKQPRCKIEGCDKYSKKMVFVLNTGLNYIRKNVLHVHFLLFI